MWWFLVIAVIALALVWQIPAIGPVLSILLLVGIVAFFWWAMRSAPHRNRAGSPQGNAALRARTERAKADSRASRIEIKIKPPTPGERQAIMREDRDLAVCSAMWEAGKIAGEIEGEHYTKWAPVINDLKREGRYFEALELCLECIDATERQSKVDGLGVPPGYTRNAAIIYRKLKDYRGEVAILERYLRSGGKSTELQARLEKARVLASKNQ